MSYAITRSILANRPISQAQAVQSAAHVGANMAAPAAGVVINDIDLTNFEQLLFHFKSHSLAYTGGTTNPTLTVRLQRKIDPTLPDTDSAAWEDLVTLSVNVAAVESVCVVGATPQVTASPVTVLLWNPTRDSLADGAMRAGHPGNKLRVRESTTGGDRTGGTSQYDIQLTGIAFGDGGVQ